MAEKTRSNPLTERRIKREEIEINRQQAISSMLEDEGFVNVLAENGFDEVTDENYDDVSELYEKHQEHQKTMEISAEVTAGVKDFYIREIRRLGGLDIDESAFDVIGEHIDLLAHHNPEELQRLAKRLELFHKYEHAISQMKERFRSVGESGNLQDMAATIDELFADSQKRRLMPSAKKKMLGKYFKDMDSRLLTPEAKAANKKLYEDLKIKKGTEQRAAKSLRALDQVKRDILTKAGGASAVFEEAKRAVERAFEESAGVDAQASEENLTKTREIHTNVRESDFEIEAENMDSMKEEMEERFTKKVLDTLRQSKSTKLSEMVRALDNVIGLNNPENTQILLEAIQRFSREASKDKAANVLLAKTYARRIEKTAALAA